MAKRARTSIHKAEPANACSRVTVLTSLEARGRRPSCQDGRQRDSPPRLLGSSERFIDLILAHYCSGRRWWLGRARHGILPSTHSPHTRRRCWRWPSMLYLGFHSGVCSGADEPSYCGHLLDGLLRGSCESAKEALLASFSLFEGALGT